MSVLPSEPTAALPSLTNITGVAYDPIGPRLPSSAKFDPAIHLCYKPTHKKYTFEELGLKHKGISPVAATEAFPLFTKEAIRELRKDCLSTKAQDDFTFSSKIAACQAREYHPTVAPFVNQAFTSPEFVRACSDAAGIELVPVMQLELGHTNFQVGKEGKAGIRKLGVEPSAPEPPATGTPEDDGTSVVHWHHDSYPFVAVTMLSDVTNMIGGETALECGDGSIAKIRGPELGYTCILQGRYINHIACKALNAKERITMVTSFRAKDVTLPDESVLDTIRPISKRNRLNAQWSSYRLKLVAERMTLLANKIDEESKDDVNAVKDVCNKETMQAFLDEQVKYLQHGINEMMD